MDAEIETWRPEMVRIYHGVYSLRISRGYFSDTLCVYLFLSIYIYVCVCVFMIYIYIYCMYIYIYSYLEMSCYKMIWNHTSCRNDIPTFGVIDMI